MKQSEVFSSAKWLTGEKKNEIDFFILKSRFKVSKPEKAVLRVIGLGFFHCFINGKRVGNDYFLPLSTDYEARDNYPTGEILTGHRIYVPEYDVTDLLTDGENEITVHFGGGWYTCEVEKSRYGDSKAIFRIFGNDANGEFDFVSDENAEIAESYVKDYRFTYKETQDFISEKEAEFTKALCAKPLDTEYLFTDCPADRVIYTLPCKKISEGDGCTVYDCGKNITGYPVISINADKGETVRVIHSEEILANGDIDPEFVHGQTETYISDGESRKATPLFTWYGFRYFAVYGNAVPECVEVIHSDVEINSSFDSDCELLNWINDTYINTQLMNMHTGLPSDCPHLERRGYTGDGELACHAAMNMLGAENFYRKWIEDIRDCQDTLTGHVQYTAPYIRSGGGPGGWGCAIVEVPYQFYLHYGDKTPLTECYPQMLRYFDYLEAHSEANLVTSDKKDQWCLGDWCTPVSIVLPAPFVNNYFYIKSLYRAIEIAKLLGKDNDIPEFEKRIEERKKALVAAYFNVWDGNFLGGQQGANAFMIDIGLGDERTYPNTVEYYKNLGGYDTGIFGTDIVTKVFFENGDIQLATDLMLSQSVHSFAEMKKLGATTFWEYWPESLRDRSHNHPMFGAVAAYIYDYILGIRQKDGCAGYSEIVISPVMPENLNRASGFRTLPRGKVSVAYEKTGNKISFRIVIPENQKAEFVFAGRIFELKTGINEFEFDN